MKVVLRRRICPATRIESRKIRKQYFIYMISVYNQTYKEVHVSKFFFSDQFIIFLDTPDSRDYNFHI